MPKYSNFGKKQILTIVGDLKDAAINTSDFVEMSEDISNLEEYRGSSEIDQEYIYRKLITYSSLFKESGIKIYSKEDDQKEKLNSRKICASKAISIIKSIYKKNRVTKIELQEILQKECAFTLSLNQVGFDGYDIHKILKKNGIELVEDKSKSKTKIQIDTFSNSLIVKQYKEENKQFTLQEIFRLLNNKVSQRALYNHSIYIDDIGIPLKPTKIIKNKDKSILEIINIVAQVLKQQGKLIVTAKDFMSKAIDTSFAGLINTQEIIDNKTYIYNSFDITITDRKSTKKNINRQKTTELIENIEEFLKSFTSHVAYVDEIPFFNNSMDFLIHIDVNIKLEELWSNFILNYIKSIAVTRADIQKELLDENNQLKINTENKKFIFLQHDKLHIGNLEINDIVGLSRIDILSKDKSYQIHRQNMYIGFLFYLHSKNLLLFPLRSIFQIYYSGKKAQSELEMFLAENTIYKRFKQAEDENRLIDKDIKKQRIFYFLLYTLSSKINIDDMQEEMVEDLANFSSANYPRIRNILRTLGSSSFPPLDTSLQYTKEYYVYMKDERYTSLIEMFNKHMNRMVKMKETKTPKGFNKKFSGVCVSFFRFLDVQYPSMDINAKSLYQIFDYPDSKLLTYQEHVEMMKNKKGQPLGDGTKNSKLYPLSIAFSKSEKYKNVFNPSKIPNYSTGSGEESSRVPIDDDEIILKLDDIVTNRPPKSDYFKNHKVHIDTSWWKHMENVRPFEPLIIKLHLRIPARGKTLRLTDRDTLLVTNSQNEITGFNFKSDKFKKRTTPFIVPNIWQSELNFLVNLIEYNKHYFPKLSRVSVDDTTIPQGIMPLFPNDDGTSEFKDTAHLAYWKKVLMQAEIEFRQEGKHYDLVKSETVDLPQTVEEMEMLTKGELDTFKRKYDLHSLRHTGITRYITGGMPLELVRMLSGHSGYNTLLTVYYHVNQQTLIDAWTKKEKIDPTAILNMHDVSDIFIKKKLIEDITSENPDEVLQVLKEEHFFNLSNRSREKHENIQLSDISKLNPIYYSSADGCGICPKRACPDEFAGRCSLCPYFTTNYLFVEEIGLRVQLSMDRTKKFSELMNKNREKKENQKNKELKKDLLLEMENFYGWMEVLALIDDSYKNMEINTTDNKSSQTTDNKNLTAMSSGVVKSMFTIVPALDVNHANLDTLSKAYAKNMLDNETVRDITNYMANKLIRHTANNGNYGEIESLSNEEIIKWFLPKYDKLPKDWHNNRKSKEEIESFLEIFERKNTKLPQGSNYEDTLLAQ